MCNNTVGVVMQKGSEDPSPWIYGGGVPVSC